MRVTVNGRERELAAGSSVRDLLLLDGEPVGHVVVEVNREYLPRDQYGVRLREGDRVEIIHPAFGG